MKPDVITPERLKNALILIVDDIEINRALLARSLDNRGYKRVITAHDGAEALQLTHEQKPDLVILDLVMPGMDGFSYCQAIRRDAAFDDMPIIVQTLLEEMEDKIKAFNLGASDYICKPINLDELGARTQVHLMKRLLMQDMRQCQQQIHNEMNAARAMQNRLMPDTAHIAMCERLFNMKIAMHFETCSALGGDGWGLLPLSDQKLGLYMYDFSGHGVSAAMNIFRLHTLMQECLHAAPEPAAFLNALNQHMYPLLERNEYATMFYGIIDNEKNCLLYAAAAAPQPMICNRRGEKPVVLSGRGFPLGAVAHAAYETRYTAFMPDDMPLLFSDCLSETEDSSGAFLRDEQIEERIAARGWQQKNPAQATIDALLQLLHEHNSGPIRDDLTINAFWRCA